MLEKKYFEPKMFDDDIFLQNQTLLNQMKPPSMQALVEKYLTNAEGSVCPRKNQKAKKQDKTYKEFLPTNTRLQEERDLKKKFKTVETQTSAESLSEARGEVTYWSDLLASPKSICNLNDNLSYLQAMLPQKKREQECISINENIKPQLPKRQDPGLAYLRNASPSRSSEIVPEKKLSSLQAMLPPRKSDQGHIPSREKFRFQLPKGDDDIPYCQKTSPSPSSIIVPEKKLSFLQDRPRFSQNERSQQYEVRSKKFNQQPCSQQPQYCDVQFPHKPLQQKTPCCELICHSTPSSSDLPVGYPLRRSRRSMPLNEPIILPQPCIPSLHYMPGPQQHKIPLQQCSPQQKKDKICPQTHLQQIPHHYQYTSYPKSFEPYLNPYNSYCDPYYSNNFMKQRNDIQSSEFGTSLPPCEKELRWGGSCPRQHKSPSQLGKSSFDPDHRLSSIHRTPQVTNVPDSINERESPSEYSVHENQASVPNLETRKPSVEITSYVSFIEPEDVVEPYIMQSYSSMEEQPHHAGEILEAAIETNTCDDEFYQQYYDDKKLDNISETHLNLSEILEDREIKDIFEKSKPPLPDTYGEEQYVDNVIATLASSLHSAVLDSSNVTDIYQNYDTKHPSDSWGKKESLPKSLANKFTRPLPVFRSTFDGSLDRENETDFQVFNQIKQGLRKTRRTSLPSPLKNEFQGLPLSWQLNVNDMDIDKLEAYVKTKNVRSKSLAEKCLHRAHSEKTKRVSFSGFESSMFTNDKPLPAFKQFDGSKDSLKKILKKDSSSVQPLNLIKGEEQSSAKVKSTDFYDAQYQEKNILLSTEIPRKSSSLLFLNQYVPAEPIQTIHSDKNVLKKEGTDQDKETEIEVSSIDEISNENQHMIKFQTSEALGVKPVSEQSDFISSQTQIAKEIARPPSKRYLDDYKSDSVDSTIEVSSQTFGKETVQGKALVTAKFSNDGVSEKHHESLLGEERPSTGSLAKSILKNRSSTSTQDEIDVQISEKEIADIQNKILFSNGSYPRLSNLAGMELDNNLGILKQSLDNLLSKNENKNSFSVITSKENITKEENSKAAYNHTNPEVSFQVTPSLDDVRSIVSEEELVSNLNGSHGSLKKISGRKENVINAFKKFSFENNTPVISEDIAFNINDFRGSISNTSDDKNNVSVTDSEKPTAKNEAYLSSGSFVSNLNGFHGNITKVSDNGDDNDGLKNFSFEDNIDVDWNSKHHQKCLNKRDNFEIAGKEDILKRSLENILSYDKEDLQANLNSSHKLWNNKDSLKPEDSKNALNLSFETKSPQNKGFVNSNLDISSIKTLNKQGSSSFKGANRENVSKQSLENISLNTKETVGLDVRKQSTLDDRDGFKSRSIDAVSKKFLENVPPKSEENIVGQPKGLNKSDSFKVGSTDDVPQKTLKKMSTDSKGNIVLDSSSQKSLSKKDSLKGRDVEDISKRSLENMPSNSKENIISSQSSLNKKSSIGLGSFEDLSKQSFQDMTSNSKENIVLDSGSRRSLSKRDNYRDRSVENVSKQSFKDRTFKTKEDNERNSSGLKSLSNVNSVRGRSVENISKKSLEHMTSTSKKNSTQNSSSQRRVSTRDSFEVDGTANVSRLSLTKAPSNSKKNIVGSQTSLSKYSYKLGSNKDMSKQNFELKSLESKESIEQNTSSNRSLTKKNSYKLGSMDNTSTGDDVSSKSKKKVESDISSLKTDGVFKSVSVAQCLLTWSNVAESQSLVLIKQVDVFHSAMSCDIHY